MSRTLMIQGTSSDAGKSTLATGLCRILQRRGYKVAPFKPQNMALNSAVTVDGGEIGRAQALQAQACGIAALTDMNPILLKPNTETGAQVIINGQPYGNMDARAYHQFKQTAMRYVLEAYERLCQQFNYIVVEGAGSPAEINLRDHDIANMGFAEQVNCPVLLVADIDRGGVFANIVGTLALLSASERNRIIGVVINRFRGDIGLLQEGLIWLEKKVGKPVFGVLPYISQLQLDAEDSLAKVNDRHAVSKNAQLLRVIVPVLSRLSNHTDFDPLRHHAQVDIKFIQAGEPIPAADLIIIPGTKNVRADRVWLAEQGWDTAIRCHLRYGGKLMGLCGGYQMLGQRIDDPNGVEGPVGITQGLALLDFETILARDKVLTNRTGQLVLANASVSGYEIHMGYTHGPALMRPLIHYDEQVEGVVSEDNLIIGTYWHGLFEQRTACEALLQWAGLASQHDTQDFDKLREHSIDRVAATMLQHLDLAGLL